MLSYETAKWCNALLATAEQLCKQNEAVNFGETVNFVGIAGDHVLSIHHPLY
jgi:hypothetical protein